MTFLKILRRFWVVFLVIALYLAISGLTNWLPARLNIFKGSDVEMLETPVVVKEIRKIGKLVSAEYYGEVYTDLFEAFDKMIQKDSTKIDSLYKIYPLLKKYDQSRLDYLDAQEAYQESLKKLSDLQRNVASKEEVVRFRENEADELKDKYKDFPVFSQERKNAKDLYQKANESYKQARNELRDLEGDLKQEQRQLGKLEKDMENAEEDYRKFKKRNNLVYIGRGWVKAGFDLQQIKPDNDDFQGDVQIDDDDSLTIKVRIPKPEILYSTINPWFIPGEVQGYEIFINANNTYADSEVKLVKVECVRKLEQDAIEKGILQMAERTGVQTLENFFLLLGFEKAEFVYKPEPALVESK